MEGTIEGTIETGSVGQDPIRRPLLHEEIVQRIGDLIFVGELPPGERVPEKELCIRFNISRTPLREALKVLASEELITLLPNRGARVTQLTPEGADELFPVMGALEALSGELACLRVTTDDIAEVKALHYQMALHHTRGERENYFHINQNIHRKIMEIAGNPTLMSTYDSLAGRIRRVRYLANASRIRWDQAMIEHESILAALEARNGVQLAAILKDHLMNKLAAVKSILEAGIKR